jgi:hypothetical protein
MENYETVKINDKEYYQASDIYKFDSAFFYGTNNNLRNIVDKKKISDEEYIYAYIKDKEWIISNRKYCKSKLLLESNWCINNVPKFAKNTNILLKYEQAPPVLELDDDEKLKIDDVIYNIEIRGERKVNNCYFDVDDISKSFELKNLKRIIVDKNTGYELNVHYKCFSNDHYNNLGNKKNVDLKKIYLTYKGLIRCLYVSRNPKVDKFQDWANQILFTNQFGSKEDKTKLASKLLGVHYKAVSEVFKTSARNIPCVYLFTLGSAKNLRDSMNLDKNIKDDNIICKYGMTDNLERRAAEHNRNFNKIKNADLHLKYYSYIDPQYISEAENDITGVFDHEEYKLQYENFTELVVITPKKLNDHIKKQYIGLSERYAGHVTELVSKIKYMEQQHKIDLLEKDNQIKLLEKDIENERNMSQYKLSEKDYQLKLLEKDNQIKDMMLEQEKRLRYIAEKELELYKCDK